MRKLSLFAALAALALSSCGATMRLQGTAPNQDADGTCAAPILYPMPLPNPALKMHFQWTGPVAGEDSIVAVPGSPFVYTRNAPSGVYTVRCWASDLGGAGCDTTITVAVKGKPAKPAMVTP